jgi:DNA adenine methylase
MSPALKALPSIVEPRPFLKWAGGKAKLAPEILQRFPSHFKRYHEPFIGGGAVFFALGPRQATLSDLNAELIATYVTIRDQVDDVIAALASHAANEEHFYAVRAMSTQTLGPVEVAARTIYLNRTCYNGLYRVNSKGQFNVPFGRYTNPRIVNSENLHAVSAALAGMDILHQSVFDIGHRVRPGDLVYFDPPYDPLSPTASFTSYAGTFGREEQIRLFELFRELAHRGVHVVLSNSDTPFIRALYHAFKVETVYCRRPINSRADRRGPVTEVLVSVG